MTVFPPLPLGPLNVRLIIFFVSVNKNIIFKLHGLVILWNNNSPLFASKHIFINSLTVIFPACLSNSSLSSSNFFFFAFSFSNLSFSIRIYSIFCLFLISSFLLSSSNLFCSSSFFCSSGLVLFVLFESEPKTSSKNLSNDSVRLNSFSFFFSVPFFWLSEIVWLF